MFSHVLKCVALAGAALCASLSVSAQDAVKPASGPLDGNRYMHERFYAADISAASAYLRSQRTGAGRLAIVDVRDATEYRNGHPAGARHIPYPRVFQECNANPKAPGDTVLRSEDGGTCLYGTKSGSVVRMSDEELFKAFEAAYPDKNQAFALLCRTGSRSAKAGNVLSNPEKYLGAAYAGRGYKQVFNIWEGFVGMPLVPIHPDTRTVIGAEGGTVPITLENGMQAVGFKPAYLDLDKDGKITNADLDGWRYHQGLPFELTMDKAHLNAKAAPYYEKN
ncbi:rhodanese-like domain-containing protein [Ramlibacter sp. MAHUQ-53]|uniref:rhodanese-like domain-containing protein n=1 Tax=unclassified Ramlibacter TaxID=2617605 RepID=UPI00363016AC